MLCVAVMFLMSWSTALITFIVIIALYLFVSHRKPGNLTFLLLCIINTYNKYLMQ